MPPIRYMTPIKQGSVAPPAFVPESLPLDFLFYKDYTESGGIITQWTDTMGNYNATPVNSPTINSADTSINNKFSVNFVTANARYLHFGGSTNIADIAQPFTLISVDNINTTTPSFYQVGGVKGPVSALLLAYNPSGTFGFQYGGWFSGTAAPGVRVSITAVTGWRVTVLTYPGTGGNTTVSAYWSNSLQTLVATPNGSTNNVASRIGANLNTSISTYFSGKIAFFAGGKFLISSGQRTDLMNWITSYYGLS